MKTWSKVAVCILLTFLCLFTTIGYASFSAQMTVSGLAKLDVPYGLFITSVSTVGATNVDSNTVTYLDFSTTVDSTINRRSGTGTVTYSVTVLNNTDLVYSYRGIYYQTTLDGYNGN